MAPQVLLPLLCNATEYAIVTAGGAAGWEVLSESEKGQRNQETYREICQELGQAAFDKLSVSDKEAIDWFVWCGCCMHKELNMVKGGNACMTRWWEEQGVPGPLKLMNRDNAAAVTGGVSVASSRAVEVSQGGAVKATSLAGAVFCHKDDKKGQQDSLKFFFEDSIGYTITFPDMSNTCYQSHCKAASELLVNLELYIQFLKIVKDKKDSCSLNHMEQNVYATLHDAPMIHKLCTLSLFSQLVSHPYMRQIRGPGQANTNVLDLGPLHVEIQVFMQKIINDLDILLSASATYLTASFDARPWDRPEAFYAIQRLSPTLPHLKGILVAFFEGALVTWTQFIEEFKPDGKIANAAPELCEASWMPTTNDVNEGVLGSFHVATQRYPSISQHQLNVQTCYKRNKTSDYIRDHMDDTTRTHLHTQARKLDRQHLEKQQRRDQASYDKAVVAKKHSQDLLKQHKRDAAAAKVAAITPILDTAKLTQARLANVKLDAQLDWHRQFSDQIPKKKDVLTKALKLKAVQDAIGAYLSSQSTTATLYTMPQDSEIGEMELEEDWHSDDER